MAGKRLFETELDLSKTTLPGQADFNDWLGKPWNHQLPTTCGGLPVRRPALKRGK
ncbi:hypothetical protein [Sterolibacterium denitrificans]|uniref:hypothetical protein n=1 Tax=Sterolibacterium denitrificans TaxID=157592 RepID=UPI0012B69B5C|nr:hypothetical protein [Sterolibacterium denitrificans]